MKSNYCKNMVAVMAITGLTLTGTSLLAQGLSAATTVQSTSVAAAPQLAYGVPQILQLVQAKIGDDTIIAYIKSSGTCYGLNADQIIYLHQQGVSAAILNAMLTLPRPAAAVAAPAPPAPQPVASIANTAEVSTATVAPTVTYIQAAPQTVYYDQPYYYPAYGYYPPVAFSVGWGWSGGWHGGWHR